MTRICDLSTRSKHFGIKFTVDERDYETYVKPYSFSLNNYGYVRYSSGKDGLNSKLLHRVIMGVEDRWSLVDHINGNPLDNRRENLRVCSQQENSCNRGKNSNNKSGYKGVSWNKQCEKWRAAINGKHIGIFDTPEEAHQAYCEAARELHNEFAHH